MIEDDVLEVEFEDELTENPVSGERVFDPPKPKHKRKRRKKYNETDEDLGIVKMT